MKRKTLIYKHSIIISLFLMFTDVMLLSLHEGFILFFSYYLLFAFFVIMVGYNTKKVVQYDKINAEYLGYVAICNNLRRLILFEMKFYLYTIGILHETRSAYTEMICRIRVPHLIASLKMHRKNAFKLKKYEKLQSLLIEKYIVNELVVSNFDNGLNLYRL